MSARRSKRNGEAGYALIVAAIAVLFLAAVTSVIVHAAAGGAMSSRLDAERERAALNAAAGLEWTLLTGQTGTQNFQGGTFTVTRSGRRVTSRGDRAGAQRTAEAELTIFYVPDSRYAGENSQVTFEVVNKTNEDLLLTGWSAALSTTAFYEEIRLRIFDEPPSLPGVDYGAVWNYNVNNNGRRAQSGEALTFGGAARPFGRNRQAIVEVTGFRTARQGPASSFDMDTHEMSIRFTTATGDLASTAVPRVEP